MTERLLDQEPAASAGRSVLSLGHDVYLTIDGDSLLAQGVKVKNKSKSRSCIPFGASSSEKSNAPQSIPLYNILWAEHCEDEQTLTIDYAETLTKVRLRAAKLTIRTAPTSSATDDENLYPPAAAIAKWVDILMSRAYGSAPRQKRAYVLVNPHAGPGGAQQYWDHDVKPIFEAARLPLTVHTTTHSGEALGLVRELDIDQFDIVVPCSGDGLAYEIFNGLASRPDSQRALNTLAVAHIPCGSGNALACNVFGTNKPSLAALAIVKGMPTPIDLASITQGETRTISFLSQTLGVMAEADLATEHLRWMGEARFFYGALTRILKKKEYPCDLYVKMEVDHKHGVREHYKRHREGSATAGEIPFAKDAEGEASTDSPGLPPLKYGTIHDKLPEDWVKVDAEKIGTIFTGNLAYMSSDSLMFNAALLSDGCLDVYLIDGNVPYAKIPGLLMSLDDNSWMDHPLIQYFKVSAYRIAPKYPEGYISIDGEKVPFEPFQVEVHRGLGLVITKNGGIEAPGPKNWDTVTASQRIIP